jgi:hypothetical protein
MRGPIAAFLLGAPIVAMASIGCGPSRGTVEGIVRYEGRPVLDGFVMLHPTNGNYRDAASVKISEGRFRLEGVVLGEKTVALENLTYQDEKTGEPKAVPGDARGSPETIEIVAGPQTVDLEMRRRKGPGR